MPLFAFSFSINDFSSGIFSFQICKEDQVRYPIEIRFDYFLQYFHDLRHLRHHHKNGLRGDERL